MGGGGAQGSHSAISQHCQLDRKLGKQWLRLGLSLVSPLQA